MEHTMQVNDNLQVIFGSPLDCLVNVFQLAWLTVSFDETMRLPTGIRTLNPWFVGSHIPRPIANGQADMVQAGEYDNMSTRCQRHSCRSQCALQVAERPA